MPSEAEEEWLSTQVRFCGRPPSQVLAFCRRRRAVRRVGPPTRARLIDIPAECYLALFKGATPQPALYALTGRSGVSSGPGLRAGGRRQLGRSGSRRRRRIHASLCRGAHHSRDGAGAAGAGFNRGFGCPQLTMNASTATSSVIKGLERAPACGRSAFAAVGLLGPLG